MRSLTYLEIDVPDFEIGQNDVLLQFEGADATTVFTDDSGRIWTANGNAQIDTAQFKFGTSSGLFDGTGDYITTPDVADLEFGSGEFTIDFWFRCNAATGVLSGIAGKGANDMIATPANGSFLIRRNATDTIEFRFGFGTTLESAFSTTLFTNATNTGWHHCAIVRDNNNADTIRLFIDGIQEDAEPVSGAVNDVASLLTIGRWGDGTDGWNGHLDEFRITVGYARWRSNFTPPTRAVGGADTTLRFAIDSGYNPTDIEAIASLTGISFTPANVSIGENLGQRATLNATFKDHEHIHFTDSFDSGTFWGKFRARYGNKLRGRKARWIVGLEGQSFSQMNTRHFFIDSVEGPSPKGSYSIIAKDGLKFIDNDRAVAPRPSTGQLNTTMTTTTLEVTLTPTGVGNLEYPASGHVNIGGTEIAAFARDASVGDDANAVYLLHFEGTDGSTSFADDGSVGFGVVASGNAQIDTADKKFGTSSGLFDGTGDYLSSTDNNAWTFSGDFTMECQAKFSSLAVARTLLCHSTDINNMYRLFVTTAGALTFSVISASVTIITLASANGLIVTGQWYHLAVVRSGSIFKLYIDGVEVATVNDADAIPNFTSSFRVGISGNASSDPMQGWIDEVRVSNVARWTDDFTPPIVAYQSSGDIMVLTRAQMNTEAKAHAQGERMQLVLSFFGVDPALIIYQLLIDYADVPSSVTLLSEWYNETQSFFQRVLTANIAEPTGINKLVSEIIEQAALVMWWDDVLEKIRLQVIRPISTTANTFDESNTIEGSLNVIEQPSTRISQVYTYFNQLNPLKGISDVDNFLSAALTVDLDSEGDYGGPAIKTILSRWIPSGGRTTALRLNDLMIERFRDAPRKFMLDIFRYQDGVIDPVLAGGYKVGSWCLQDVLGAAVLAPVQVTRLNPLQDRFQIEAQEMLFSDSVSDDPYDRTIIIDANQNNVNMRTLHDGIFVAPDGVTATTVTCIIESGVVVGSNLPSDGTTPQISFDVGTWPAAVTLILIINGEIIGHGGAGGLGGPASFGAGFVGKQGGTALYTREAISVQNNNAIRGGGGGGGGAHGVLDAAGGGGGGGSGVRSGLGGSGGSGNPTAPPTPGSLGIPEGTGEGGNDWRSDTPNNGKGGLGGAYGTAGGTAQGNGGPGTGAVGGAAGNSIDGVSFVTMSGSGVEQGPQIN